MNMVMNNDGRGGIYPENSLWKPSRWKSKSAQKDIELGSMDIVMIIVEYLRWIVAKSRIHNTAFTIQAGLVDGPTDSQYIVNTV